MDGVINVLKPPGMTSYEVVAYIRRLLKIKKVGHTGTLDPAAAGVLVICLGKGTKVSRFLLSSAKTYRAEVTLGIRTSTLDAEGEIISREAVCPISEDKVREALRQFIGDIEQIPPMASAIHHQGQRLYELARRGEEVERESRKVHIYRLEQIDYREGKYPILILEIDCSKGTYVRTLCSDIGEALGWGAYTSFLLRTRVGPFKIEEAVTLEELRENDPVNMIEPLDKALSHLPPFIVKAKVVKKARNGATLFPNDIEGEEDFELGDIVRIYDPSDELIGIYRIDTDHQRKFVPLRILVS